MRNLPKALILAASLTTYGLGAGPALAQGPPTSNVRVVNTSAQPVPVQVTNSATQLVPVQVTNPATQPVPVQVALPEPFQMTRNANFTDSTIAFIQAVPAGKRLVIESVSVQVNVPTGQKVLATLETNDITLSPERKGSQFVPMFLQGPFGGGDVYVGSQACLLYGEGPSGIFFRVVRSATTGSAVFVVSLTGHLEPAP